MITRLAAVSLALALAGCASYTWTRPGTSPETTRADQMACYQTAARPANVFDAAARAKAGPGVESQMMSAEAGTACMQSLGYTQVPN